MYTTFKRLVVGAPVTLREEETQKLGKPTALAVFSSDAISSTAYATDQILLILLPAAGVAAFGYLVPISLVVVVLLAVVAISYRQTIYAYPNGGGSYVVSRENLGVNPSLVAGGSLMVDYLLTVSVSVSSGVAALIAAVPELDGFRVPLCVVMILLMALANLRGLKASGKTFAGPTYVYVAMLVILLGTGLVRSALGNLPAPDTATEARDLADAGLSAVTLTGVSFLVILRAFSSGAVALTGVEAISNGVPAFRQPRSRNAATTLVIMAVILGGGFVGISALADKLEPIPTATQTVLSSMGTTVFGGQSVLFYLLQGATLLILILAANTSFADFPRVASIMARDGYLPNQLADRGDRLVYSNGIIVLALFASALVIAFDGDTDRLVPLYAIGVFCAFTLSQSGMVRHHLRLRERGWRVKLAINGVGACTTLIVLGVVAVSKFTEGVWIPLVLIPLLVLLFRRVHAHYTRVRAQLEIPPTFEVHQRENTVVVVFTRLHVGVLEALGYAMSLGPTRLVPLAVVIDDESATALRDEWARRDLQGDLEVLVSPQADLADPVLAHLEGIDRAHPGGMTTIIIPEYVLPHWWEQTMHNQNVMRLRARLRLRQHTVIAAVPVRIAPLHEHELEHPPP